MTSSFYTINFEKEYLQYNFDNLLRETNSKLVNEPIYLDVKASYFEQTIVRFEQFKEHSEKLTQLLQSDIYYIDSEKQLKDVKNVLKKILFDQKTIYQNFIQHIQFLRNIR